MKKLNLFVITFILSVGLYSCSSDDDSNSVNNGSVTEIVNAAKAGTWYISNFVEDGNNETQHFTGYTFTFDDNNVVTATNGTDTYTGTWSVTNDDSSDDDNSSSDIDFNIGFASPQEFIDLTDDWDIVEQTSNKIELIDVSGGNGGTDYLTFEKN